jgi:hypothetical protein
MAPKKNDAAPTKKAILALPAPMPLRRDTYILGSPEPEKLYDAKALRSCRECARKDHWRNLECHAVHDHANLGKEEKTWDYMCVYCVAAREGIEPGAAVKLMQAAKSQNNTYRAASFKSCKLDQKALCDSSASVSLGVADSVGCVGGSSSSSGAAASAGQASESACAVEPTAPQSNRKRKREFRMTLNHKIDEAKTLHLTAEWTNGQIYDPDTKTTFRCFFSCLAGTANQECNTLILCNKRSRLYDDALSTSQRYLCKVCNTKYMTKYGLVIEMIVEGQSYLARVPLPELRWEDFSWLLTEAHKTVNNAESLLAMMPNIHPTPSEHMPEVEEGVHTLNRDVLNNLPVWNWDELVRLASLMF